MLELLYDPKTQITRFAYWKDGGWQYENDHRLNDTAVLIPYSAQNYLVKNEIVLLSSQPEEYGSELELLQSVKDFIHKYVAVSPLYEDIASYYVLFSWVYDGFNELPYLRVRGDPGCGKTRFLLTVGSLCYKPIFASGASSVSPLFRLLESFRGTLIIDESDFRFSDEKAELVKILNNGNVRGFPVLRSESNGKGEYNPFAYQVYGPKILASRGDFQDLALESRFLSEEMGSGELRPDIPINLPVAYRGEAQVLRNKLLMFRFRNRNKPRNLAGMTDAGLEPRLNQIFNPLFSIIDEPAARDRLRVIIAQAQKDLVQERGYKVEGQVLEVIQELMVFNEVKLSIREITARFKDIHADEQDYKISPKWIGNVIRKKLHLKTEKSHGTFKIADSELSKLAGLFRRYGLAATQGESPADMVKC
jgi:hypothetical protein